MTLNNELGRVRLEILDRQNKRDNATRGHSTALQARNNILEARKSLMELQKEVDETRERLVCLKLIKEAFGSKESKQRS